MPQIDLLSYFSVGFYTAILFLTLVFILQNYILPKISLTLKLRNRIKIDKKETQVRKIYAKRIMINERMNEIKKIKEETLTQNKI